MSGGLYGRLDAELNAREKSSGLTMAELLDLPDDERQVVNWLLRNRTASLSEVAGFLSGDRQAARNLLAGMVEKGHVLEFERHGEPCFRVRLAPKRGRTMSENLWQAIDDKVEE